MVEEMKPVVAEEKILSSEIIKKSIIWIFWLSRFWCEEVNSDLMFQSVSTFFKLPADVNLENIQFLVLEY